MNLELGNHTHNNIIIIITIYSMTEFSFIGSFNMGYEGFSKPFHLARMHPILGNSGEFLVLFAFLALVPIVRSARKKNEDALR